MRSATAWFAVALLALAAALSADPARANGVPQLVKLTYLEGVSNWGPQDAEGVLEFSFAEAYARVDVKNLPPVEGYEYEGWMVAPDGATYFVGTIDVDSSGVGALETKLEGLTRYDYDLFVIAARSAADPPGALPEARSIAGRFTVIPDEPGGTNPGDIVPRTLPDTGERPTSTLLGRILITASAVILTAVLLRLWLRRGRETNR